MAETKTHIGRNVGRLRDLKGMKQETLANLLGLSQQAVSKIEQSESVDETTLERIAIALNLTPNAIKHFNEDSVFNNIQTNSDTATNNMIINYQLGQVEKITELYEALLKSEREKVALMERVIAKLESK